MHPLFRVAVLAALVLFVAGVDARAQSVTFDFQDNTDQGFGAKFSNDGSETFPIDNVGGSLRMRVVRNGDFQEAEHASGANAAFNPAMAAAAANEALYEMSYDYYIDTANWGANAGSFLQLGTYVNSGSGYYAQDFPGTGKDLELNSTQLASGQLFQGTITETFAAKGYDIPLGETFFRLGLIINGDGSAQTVHFDNISVRPVPEPASLGLLALALPALALRRRRA